MAETLFIRLSESDCDWCLFDATGEATSQGQGPLESLTTVVGEDFQGRVVGVVAGESVLLTQARVPSRQYRQIVQALPFAVEEQLAADVEDCFFALGDRGAGDQIPVAVVNRDLMDRWNEQLSAITPAVKVLVSESMLAAQPANPPAAELLAACAVIEGDRVHFGWQGGLAMTARYSDLPLLVSLAGELDTLDIQVSTDQVSQIAIQIGEIEALGVDVSVTEFSDHAFVILCSHYQNASDGTGKRQARVSPQINLLQGPYKIAEKQSKSQSLWRSVATLAGIALVLHLLLTGLQGWYLANQSDGFAAQTQALYQSVFPNDRNVRDVRRRWNSNLGESASAGNAFIQLFATSARGLSGAGLTLTNVNFNETRGDLVLQVTGPRSEALVQYAQALTAQGLSAEIGTISQEDSAVRGSIRVRLEARS